jgi:hypothetical protein
MSTPTKVVAPKKVESKPVTVLQKKAKVERKQATEVRDYKIEVS